MGLTYKVLKHRNMELDLSKPSRSKAAEEAARLESETLEKSPFTAEHIMQLCRFLAEKSQAKKNRQRLQNLQQQHYQNVDCPNARMEYETSEAVMRLETATHSPPYTANSSPTTTLTADIQMTSATAAAATTTIKPTAAHVLLDKLSPANNNANHNIAPQFTTAGTQQKPTPPPPQLQLQQQLQLHHQPHQNQDKREILLKIRQQIFERKRLRQLVRVQRRLTADVWRPW